MVYTEIKACDCGTVFGESGFYKSHQAGQHPDCTADSVRVEIEEIATAYRKQKNVWGRIAVLNDERWSFAARCTAAIELAGGGAA